MADDSSITRRGAGEAETRPRHDGSADLKIVETNLVLELARNKLEQIDDDTLSRLNSQQREELFGNIERLEEEKARLGRRCPYCRQRLSADYGLCEQCGREVCSQCGQIANGVVLHSGNCAMFYHQQQK